MDIAHIDWIPEGTRFGVTEMAYFVGRGECDIDDALADIHLVVTGPHASAAFPAEVQPFVDVRLTKRLQYDFTDVSTSPVARRWAEINPHVLYIEDPHPRLEVCGPHAVLSEQATPDAVELRSRHAGLDRIEHLLQHRRYGLPDASKAVDVTLVLDGHRCFNDGDRITRNVIISCA